MNKQKLIGAIIGVLLFIVAIAGLTYAYTIWTSEDMNKIVSSKCFDILYTKGQDITGPIMPSDTYLGGENSTFKLNIKSSCNINAKGKLYLNTSEDTSENLYTRGLLNYYVTKEDTFISSGNITSSGEIEIDLGVLEAKESATTNYTVYVWIDNNLVENSDAFSSYSGNVRVEVVQTQKGPSTNINLLTHITNLYTSKGPEPIEHKDTDGNKIAEYYYSYQDDDETWGLMNDGFKIDTSLDATTTGLATTVTSTEALTSGTEGNIRYFGPSDKVNNYIYFNCSDYSNQTDSTCEKWRIIGIVDGKVKLIRNDSIGDYSWDNKDTTTGAETDYGSNNWSNARLMKLLNPEYENEGVGGSLYWNRVSGTCYSGQNNATKTCDFTSTGIKNDTTKNMISESTWYLGGYNIAEIYPNQIYAYERTNKIGTTISGTNPYTIDAKIGLMYASDYGYGANLTKCKRNIFRYNGYISLDSTDSYACREDNWLFGAWEWLITPGSSGTREVWNVFLDGHVDDGFSGIACEDAGVRPVLYLDKNVIINNKGAGTSDNPYQIYVDTKLTDHIINLYTNGTPILITHSKDDGTSDTYYYSYQDGNKDWGLMNDGLKVDSSLDATTTGQATTVDSDAAENGTEGNIRYFGPSDKVNNYIYFNCSDYSNQTDSTCEKWRIIGIVDGKVKIIRNESIGKLAWDYDKNQDPSLTTYSNNWQTSSLQEFLNKVYYDRGTITTHTYYSLVGSGGETEDSTILDMITIGLKNEETRNMISETTWYLGGYSRSYSLYPNDIYKFERTNKTGTTIYSGNPYTIDAKIGIMYPSDYSYGTDLTKCSQTIRNYDNNADSYACRANNWLYINYQQWLITPHSSNSSTAWYVYSNGYVDGVGAFSLDAFYVRGVRPVLYLDSELTIESDGDGSSTNPYRIIVR